MAIAGMKTDQARNLAAALDVSGGALIDAPLSGLCGVIIGSAYMFGHSLRDDGHQQPVGILVAATQVQKEEDNKHKSGAST